MKRLLTFLIFAISLFQLFSCDNKKEDELQYVICAGYYDSTFIYHTFANPVTLNPLPDSINPYSCFDSDTIPLDMGNSTVNLYVRIRFVYSDSSNAVNQNDIFMVENLSLYSYSNLKFVTEEKSYYVGQGHAATLWFIKAFENSGLIKTNAIWSDNYYGGRNEWFAMWEMPINGHSTLDHDGGSWYDVNSLRYVGFKYNNRLGWIEVDVSNRNYPKFIRYAIQK